MKAIDRLTLPEFLAELAAGTPTPGGGGAAASVAAHAAALAEMVAGLTLKNKKFEDVHPDMEEAVDQLQQLREAMLRQIEADAEAFETWLAAWKLPKDNPTRESVLLEASWKAAEVPLFIAELAAALVEPIEVVLTKGTPMAASDGALAVIMMAAAIRSALYNVRINLGSLPAGERVSRIGERERELLEIAAQAERSLLPLVKI